MIKLNVHSWEAFRSVAFLYPVWCRGIYSVVYHGITIDAGMSSQNVVV